VKIIPSILAVTVLTLSVVYGLSQSLLPSHALAQQPERTGDPDPFADSDKSAPKTADAEKAKAGKPRNEKTVRMKAAAKNAGEKVVANASEYIEAKLKQETNFIWPDTSLQDIVDVIISKVEIPIVIDRKSLEDAGIGTDMTTSMNLRGFPTDRFLDLICDEFELAWTVRDGYVLITTPEKLSTLLEVRVYNCSDLIEMVKKPAQPLLGGGSFGSMGGGLGGGPGVGTPGGGATQQKSGGGFFAVQFGGAGAPPAAEGTPGGSSEKVVATTDELIPDNESLINLIQSTVDPQTWSDVGGSGSIEIYHGGLLVVNHNGQVHRRVGQLLEMMRQAKEAQPGTVFRER
jgi:hypothetical protein